MPAEPASDDPIKQEESCDAWNGGSIPPLGGAQNMSDLIRSPIGRSPTARIMPIHWRTAGQEDDTGTRRRGEMRDKFLYIMILVLIAIAFFEGGYILGYLKRDEIKTKLQQVNEWVIDHGGRIVALETIQKKAEGPPLRQGSGGQGKQ